MKTLKYGYNYMLIASLALAFGMLTSPAQGQPDKVVADTTEISVGKKTFTIVKDAEKGKQVLVTKTAHVTEDTTRKRDGVKPVDVGFLNLDLGMNFLMHNNSFNLPGELSALETEPLKSSHVGLHVLPTSFNMAKGHVSLLTAITFDNNRYAFRNNVSLQPGLETVNFVQDSVTLTKNKLISWHAQIPLMLRFQTSPTNKKKNFHLAVGGYAGLLLGANLKQKSTERGKTKYHDDYNLNNLRYGLTARIGYRAFELYANYNLTPLFRDGLSPVVYPITFGITITGFAKIDS